jgi:hypothetical protein
MRDAKTHREIDVEDDGRRLTLSVSVSGATHWDECDCMCEPPEAVIVLDKAELLALLKPGAPF